MTIYTGDCLEILPLLDAESVDSVVTDPPYGISFMNKKWDHDVPSVEVWREVYRVMKPGAYLLAFFGTRTYHRGVVAIEDAGFEIRDQIQWIFGSGFPKSHDFAGEKDAEGRRVIKAEFVGHPQAEGFGTALKPAHEPIVVARKPLIGTVAENVLRYGTGGLNIDGCRVEADDGEDRSRPPRTPNAILGGGKGTNITASEHNPDGRWPANIVHDGSDEVLAAFPDAKGQQGRAVSNDTAKTNTIYGKFARNHSNNPEPRVEIEKSAARFFYCAKASPSDRNDGLDQFEAQPSAASEFRPNHTEKAAAGEDGNPYGRWKPLKNAHPTVKPTDLMRYFCRLVTPPGGTVLDPFAGSGSTGRGAVLEGFEFIGIEMLPEYVAIAEARIAAARRKYEDEVFA